MNDRWTTLFSGNNGLKDGYNKKQLLKNLFLILFGHPLGKS